jgi:hypothetical protein
MPSKSAPASNESWEGLFAGLAGLWLALALIKFGNPVILDQQIQAPSGRDELLLAPWPVSWGYALLGLVFLLGLRFWRWHTTVPGWLIALPAIWLAWQGLSALQTVDQTLTAETLKHFCACVAAFYLGMFAFSQVSRTGVFWIGVLGAFFVVLAIGWRQHFGGLEESRRALYSMPDWRSYPPEFLKKVASDRIFSTLFYPNALAGVVILLLPASLMKSWQAGKMLPPALRLTGCGFAGGVGLGCLYWSGSKAGWLIVLGQGITALLHASLPKKAKLGIAFAVAMTGVVGFWFKYQDYFDRGATSVSARFDYWRAGWAALQQKPLLGSGPGTFMVTYKVLKPRDAEMARLAHNDFLQQGSDSGWVGLVAFAGWLASGHCQSLVPDSETADLGRTDEPPGRGFDQPILGEPQAGRRRADHPHRQPRRSRCLPG